jgi:hypothetical protein
LHRAAPTGAEHLLLRIDRRLAATVAGRERAMNRERQIIGSARHQRDDRRPDAAGRQLDAGEV